MSQTQLRAAFVGTGEQAGYLLRHAFARVPWVVPVACYDRNLEVAKTFAATQADQHPLVAYPSLDAMMETAQPDIVHVCTPPGAHPENVIDIARAARTAGRVIGIHCEKPSALDLGGNDRMWKAAERSGVVLTFGYDRVFGGVQWLAELIEKGLLGDLYGGSAGWLRFDGVPRRGAFTNRALSGGGPGFDLFPHLAALILAATRLPVHSVSAETSRHAIEAGGSSGDLDPSKIDVEDAINGKLVLGRGDARVPIHFDVAWDVPIAADRKWLELFGTDGSAALKLEKLPGDDEVLVATAYFKRRGAFTEMAPNEQVRTLAECRAAQLADLGATVIARREGRPVDPVVTPAFAREVLRAVLGAYESAESGGERPSFPR